MANNGTTTVLHWTINNAAATLPDGWPLCQLYDGAVLKWQAAAGYASNGNTAFSIQYADNSVPFKCNVELFAWEASGWRSLIHKVKLDFEFPQEWECFCTNVPWLHFRNPMMYRRVDDSVRLEFHITVMAAEIQINNKPVKDVMVAPDPLKFSAPNEFTNVALIIGDKKVHVSKEFLSIHSTVFASMFMKDFAEKGKDEIELKEVVYEEFIDLLHVIFPKRVKITDATVLHILALGDRFHMEEVIDESESLLIASDKFSLVEKLALADVYRLRKLRDYCLYSSLKTQDFKLLKTSHEYSTFTDGMKAAICDRVLDLEIFEALPPGFNDWPIDYDSILARGLESHRIAKLGKHPTMSDNTFVLRWDLRNVFTITDRRAESEVIEAGGFEWTAKMQPNPTVSENVHFMMMCNHPLGDEWSCEAEVKFTLRNNRNFPFLEKRTLQFDGANNRPQLCASGYWPGLKASNGGFMVDNTINIEIHIKIMNSKCVEVAEPIVDLEKFCSPNDACNVRMIVGGEKLNVSKDFLAIHSPVFAAMFYKNFAEKEKDEIEFKDVEYKEFIDLLELIFPIHAKITGLTILHVLALADRFEIKQVLVAAEEYLLTSSKFFTAAKLQLADEYRLAKLRKQCLQSYTSVQQITGLESSSEYASFTDAMKAAICDRIMNLAKNAN